MATGDVNAPEDHEKSRPRDTGPKDDFGFEDDRIDRDGRDGGPRRRRRRSLPPEILALELEDGRLVGDVVAEFGAEVFAGSGLRLADGRLAESVIGPATVHDIGAFDGLGGFGGFRLTDEDAQAQFALRERMRKERLVALSRLGFRNTILTGPQGVTAAVPTNRRPPDPA